MSRGLTGRREVRSVRRVVTGLALVGLSLVLSVAFGRKLWPVMELLLLPPVVVALWLWARAAGSTRARWFLGTVVAALLLLVAATFLVSTTVESTSDASSVEFGWPVPWITQDVSPRIVEEDLPAQVQPFAFGSVDRVQVLHAQLAAALAVVSVLAAALAGFAYRVSTRSTRTRSP